MSGARIDWLNAPLIVLTCVLAHALPYHLLIFSYAVLGPAHYLTQISWLHDRGYFASGMRQAAPAMVVLTLLALIARGPAAAALLLMALVVALAAVLPLKRWQRVLMLALGMLMAVGLSRFGPLTLFVSLLLPTVLHVFCFTAFFIWAGALKSRNPGAWVSLFALLAGGATFLLPMPHAAAPDLAGLAFFKPVVNYLQTLPGLSPAHETSLFGFLSFAYTYHYLNWFSKAQVIRWHAIPRRRLAWIAVLYATALGVYAYDYAIGFGVLLFLSVLHVLLEFPLDIRTIGMVAKSLTHPAASARGARTPAG